MDAVLKRAGTVGDGWLTYFYTPESFTKGWEKVKAFAREAGRDPAGLTATNQLAVYVGDVAGADRRRHAPLALDGVGHGGLERVHHRARDPR